MNKPLRRVAIFCGLLVLALLVRSNWVQFVQADELKTHKNNRRVLIERYSHMRGNIIVEGKSITGSKETNGTDFKYKRTYKNGEMWAPVTGFSSQVYGSTFLEGVYDSILTGDDDRLFFNNTVDMLTGKTKQGGDVVTTLNSAAQKAAFEGLGDKKGAVAAINPQTGAVLALASTPSYDPSAIAGSSAKDGKAWEKLQGTDPVDDPRVNRALREIYPPGSTFKVVTAAAALENGLYSSIDEKTDTPLPWIMPGTTTPLPNLVDGPCKDASLKVAMQFSCNTVFGKVGSDLGVKKMAEQAEKFGFNEEQFVPVRANASRFPTEMDDSQTAQSAIGQFDVAATPLQMAMVTAAIANDGKLMQPYMVDELRDSDLDVVEKTEPKELAETMSAENAQKLQQMMEFVVTDGSGKNAQIPDVTVGGKTGTAQRGENNSKNPYAWFISYAKTDNGSPVAVAVVVEDSGAARENISGGGLAAPIAKDVMKAVLNK
ncbi:peptidoglycan D,D-transpeptidase FtsI family protein [Streptomyces sp. NPDC059506]|uniref:peptidoglycan D,D-transpeptidase FtsI family protein n=1 Tax=Streptomyces TaxID=1883 RepID=UPI0036BDB119